MNKHLPLALAVGILMVFSLNGCKNMVKVVSPEKETEDATAIVQDTLTTEVDSKQVISIDELSEPSGYINGYGYVDLGLSVKWATCNVGAKSPSDYGDYYAWGETRTKSSYDEENSVTYRKNMGSIAGNPNYDVARAKWGSTWRLPTKEEIGELVNKCTRVGTTQGGHNGYKITGPNGNSIFVPAAGWRDGTSLYVAGEIGYCWSATPYEDDTDYAYSLLIYSGYFYRNWDYRTYALSVRPVSE